MPGIKIKNAMRPFFGLVLLLCSTEISMAADIDEMLRAYFETMNECMATIESTPYPEDGLYCNRTWDQLVCWPDVRAGTVAKMLCPTYMYGELQNAYLYRECDENGQWLIPASNRSATDVMECEMEYNAKRSDEDMKDYLITIRVIYKVGYAISLVALTIAMAIFLYFKKLWCPRNIIHMNLFMSFMLRAIIVFVRDSIQDQTMAAAAKSMNNINIDDIIMSGNFTASGYSVQDVTAGCKIVHTFSQYFTACNYFWLLVEGVYLHSLITVAVFSEKAGIKWYIALGWGFPMLFIIPWVIVQATVNDEGCWDAVYLSPYFWIISAPVMLSIVVNFLLFLNTVRVLATKLRATNAAEAKKLRKLAKSTMVLIPLFGVYYMVTLGIPPQGSTGAEKFRLAWDLILASFQGLVVTILYCFMNGEVRAEISKRWHVRQLTRDINASRTCRNGHSTTFTNLTRKDSAVVKDSTEGSPSSNRKNSKSEYILMMGNGNVNKNNLSKEAEANLKIQRKDSNSNDNAPILQGAEDDPVINEEDNVELIKDFEPIRELTESPRVRGKDVSRIESEIQSSPKKSPSLKKQYNDAGAEAEFLKPLTSEQSLEDADPSPTKISIETVV
ncbi:secretin receptor-like isoform X2 [Ptychodera flava]|uniref:secretin receptor-like isoform X2 n=1 Tax=Ptychodera flava TaxID=63121 RepID=UPI003969DCEC